MIALSIAGSDSGGGAGIQADIRSLNAFGVYATTAMTAVTAQNTRGVFGVVAIDPAMVEAQIRVVVDDFDVKATKTGMLARPVTVERVSALAREGLLPHLVVDPVLVSTSGDALMEDGGADAYRNALFPFAEVITPNLREAALLCGVEITEIASIDDVATLARTLLDMGPRYVLITGGHFLTSPRGHAPDLLLSADDLVIFDTSRLETKNDHGTGCSLSSALAAGLALGRNVPEAARDAKSFVLAALTSASTWRLGEGRGPIDHLGWGE